MLFLSQPWQTLAKIVNTGYPLGSSKGGIPIFDGYRSHGTVKQVGGSRRPEDQDRMEIGRRSWRQLSYRTGARDKAIIRVKQVKPTSPLSAESNGQGKQGEKTDRLGELVAPL